MCSFLLIIKDSKRLQIDKESKEIVNLRNSCEVDMCKCILQGNYTAHWNSGATNDSYG